MSWRLRWVVLGAIVAVGSAMAVTSVYRELHQQSLLKARKAQQTELFQKLTSELERANDRLEFFKSDEGKAWLACEKLNIVGEGECIYSIARDVPHTPQLGSKTARR